MTRLARCRSVALEGVEGRVVRVEAHIGGMPGFAVVGLPDASLSEARDRVRAAVLTSGEPWPQQRITVNLSPASIPKRGTHFDLALALTVLAAHDRLPAEPMEDLVVLAELGLDGRLRRVPGVLPAVLAAAAAGFGRVVVPEGNAAEAALVPDVSVLGARSLRQVLAVLRGETVPDEPRAGASATGPARAAPRRAATARGAYAGPPAAGEEAQPDIADVRGQAVARLAAEIAAAGQHHLHLVGPPGTGKTMLAGRLPGLLPDLSREWALEVTSIHSLAGILPADRPLVTRPPFADPHHTASPVAVVGGGSRWIRPGAASCAHRGVLFLDEAPEFGPHVLETLRQPLEHGEILVSRAGATARFPARFLLVLAANPCPCGYHGGGVRACECSPDAVRRYRRRLSGPLLDRMDLTVPVKEPSLRELRADLGATEGSAVVAERVLRARRRQGRRLAGTPWTVNGEVPGPALRRLCPLPRDAATVVDNALERGMVSARGADRATRVAWTLADLRDHDVPTYADTLEALMLRLGRAA